MQVHALFTGVTANGTQPVYVIDFGPDRGINAPARPDRIYQATVTGTGTVTATITFFGSLDGTNFPATAFGTITLSGATSSSDAFVSSAAYPYIRCVVANVTGTAATVNGLMGI